MKYDIIIPYFNHSKETIRCIESVAVWSRDYRIIAISDGSDRKDVDEVEKSLENTKAIFKHLIEPKNVGFVKNTNRGLRITEAEFIAVINNDVTILNNWLDFFTQKFEKYGGNCFLGILGRDVSKSCQAISPINYPQVDYLGWSNIFSSKKCFDKVGLLDENFILGYYEDVDYGFRIKKAGLKSILLEARLHGEMIPRIQHAGGTTMNEVDKDKLRAARSYNRAYLKKKWNLQ